MNIEKKEDKVLKKNHKKLTRDRILIIACICSVTFMLLVTVGSLVFFRYQIEKSPQLVQAEAYEEFERYYVLIPSNVKSSFWQSVYKGAKLEGEKTGALIEMLGENLSTIYSEEQLMRIAIDSKVRGIIVEANERLQMKELIDEASRQGIPVVTAFGDNSLSSRQSYVSINNYNLGGEYGEQVSELAKSFFASGQKERMHVMVLVNGNTDDSSQNIVFNGLQKTLETESRYFSQIELETVAVDSDGAFAAEEDIRDIFMNKEHLPDVIICLNELNTTCVYQAVVDYNMVGQISILGYYDSDTILKAIDKNVITSTVSVDTNQVGQYCVQALNEYVETGHVSEYFSVDISIITSKNVNKYLEGGTNVE